MKDSAFIIFGPTASGKSDFAHIVAKKINGAVINIDSMQLYDSLKILTSSPKDDEKEDINYFLYNYVSYATNYNLSNYLIDLKSALEKCREKNLVPIITGGTGMYILSALNGLNIFPDIDKEIKEDIYKLIQTDGLIDAYEKLKKLDPQRASEINQNDHTRVTRSLELIIQTGKVFNELKNQKSSSLLENYETNLIYLNPAREFLYNNINERFNQFIDLGAIDEVNNFIKKSSNISIPFQKVIGLDEIKNYLDNKLSLDEVIEICSQKTRNFAKRQFTFFNNQFKQPKQVLSYNSKDEFLSLAREFKLY